MAVRVHKGEQFHYDIYVDKKIKLCRLTAGSSYEAVLLALSQHKDEKDNPYHIDRITSECVESANIIKRQNGKRKDFRIINTKR